MPDRGSSVEDAWREWGRLLALLVARYRRLDLAEDGLGDAFEAAARIWPADGTQTVTDGPFAETVEQLTGFYLVDSPDLDDLLEVCKVLGRGEGVIEVREMKGGTSS